MAVLEEAAAQALGHGDQVGHHTFLLAGMQGAGAAHAAHHLVEDQQHAVAVADLAHRLEVAWASLEVWKKPKRHAAPVQASPDMVLTTTVRRP